MLVCSSSCRFHWKSDSRKLSLTLPMTWRKKRVKLLDRIRLRNMRGVNDVKWQGHAVLELRLAGSKGSSKSEGQRSGRTAGGPGGGQQMDIQLYIFSAADSGKSGLRPGLSCQGTNEPSAWTHLLPFKKTTNCWVKFWTAESHVCAKYHFHNYPPPKKNKKQQQIAFISGPGPTLYTLNKSAILNPPRCVCAGPWNSYGIQMEEPRRSPCLLRAAACQLGTVSLWEGFIHSGRRADLQVKYTEPTTWNTSAGAADKTANCGPCWH